MVPKVEDDHLQDDDGEGNGKRRRVQRACDVCRKKKIRCDGLQPEKGACTNCASYGLDCTFADAVKRRAPPRSYVIALEARMEKAEEVIAQLAPFLDITKVLGPMPLLPSDKKEEEEETESPLVPSTAPSQETFKGMSRKSASAEDSGWDGFDGEEENEDAAYLRVSMGNISMEEQRKEEEMAREMNSTAPEDNQELFSLPFKAVCFDSSSKDASSSKRSNKNLTEVPMQFLGSASNFHILPLLEKMSQNSNNGNNRLPPSLEQIDVGEPVIDEGRETSEERDYSKIDFRWPAPDLQQKLMDAYFARPNRDMPILNEVVTRRLFRKPTWPSKEGPVIAIALGLFCVASRYVDDDRLFLEDKSPVALIWFKELASLLGDQFPCTVAAIAYLQATLLSTIYMSAIPKSTIARAWVSLSFVVRMLEDSGAHRKFTAKRLGYSLVTEETYKRLWWVTYVMDRQLSSELGRPMAIQDEDFDLDEILLVDDEYLVQASEAGTEAVQPPGKICLYEGFLQTTRLSQIVGRTLRTIYAISKSKISRGFVGRKWDSLVVADIDKSLNKWLQDVPEYLRYNPNETNVEMLMQSSRVFMQYYHTQTLIHRPFIQRENLESDDLTFKSLAIVSNAARSAIHILHNLQQRRLVVNTSAEVLSRAFSFGCMLLFISWSAHVKNLHVSKSIMEDVRKCLDVFHAMQSRWKKAAEMSRIMEIIIRRSEVPMTAPNYARPSGKRGHEEGVENGHSASTSISSTSLSRSASRDIRHLPSTAQQLPLSTMELQSAFNEESPEVANYSASTTMSSIPSLNTQQMPNSTSSMGVISSEGAVNYSAPSFFNNAGLANRNVNSNAEQWNDAQSFEQSLPSYGTDKTSMDSTIFDPSNRTLDALFGAGGSGRRQSTSQNIFGTPSAGGPFFDTEALQGTDTLNDGMGAGNLADPLDALVNIQSLWSDVDWMRALDYRQ